MNKDFDSYNTAIQFRNSQEDLYQGFCAAVTTKTLDDKNTNGWMPEQKISVEQAVLVPPQYFLSKK